MKTFALVLVSVAFAGCSGAGGSFPVTQSQTQFASRDADVRITRKPIVVVAPSNDPSATASPTAGTPTPTPTSAGLPLHERPPVPVVSAAIVYPVYSSYFKGKTPFHDTVAQLMAAGAQVLSPTIAQHYWAEGINTDAAPAGTSIGNGPIYNVHAGDPSFTFVCKAYGTCNANGLNVHFPAVAQPADGGDHHVISFDSVYAHAEVDGWGGDPSNPCRLSASAPTGVADCTWGGVFPFSGSGLETDSSGGNAAGYAYGLMDVSAQELLNGHIDHALGLIQSCLDTDGVYPAALGRNTDAGCPANLEPNARYGDMIHVKSTVDIASLGYSPFCREIVQALQTYGGYTADNNGSFGILIELEYKDNPAYTTDPWHKIIEPSITAGGDATGSGETFRFSSCLQRLKASDIEVIQISPNLP